MITREDKIRGVFSYFLLALGTAFFSFVIGGLLCAVGFFIVGLPIILFGFIGVFILPFLGLQQIIGHCPCCNMTIRALKSDHYAQCPSCHLPLKIIDGKFYYSE
jgi:uncharacterized paraquat-inducible protein A